MNAEERMLEKVCLYRGLAAAQDEEIRQRLGESEFVRVERIVSWGQASPPGFWYDQDEHEWVAVLLGRAKLQFQGAPGEEDRVVELGPGDSINIPAHCRHRVAWTIPSEATIWLAVFYR